MADYVEMWSPTGRQIVALSDGRVTAGTRLENDIVVSGDTSVSGFHLVFEAYGPGWAFRDMGSRNGTQVNGDRLLGERVLHDGDEIVFGRTRLVFRTEDAAAQPDTDSDGDRPEITKRERERADRTVPSGARSRSVHRTGHRPRGQRVTRRVGDGREATPRQFVHEVRDRGRERAAAIAPRQRSHPPRRHLDSRPAANDVVSDRYRVDAVVVDRPGSRLVRAVDTVTGDTVAIKTVTGATVEGVEAWQRLGIDAGVAAVREVCRRRRRRHHRHRLGRRHRSGGPGAGGRRAGSAVFPGGRVVARRRRGA